MSTFDDLMLYRENHEQRNHLENNEASKVIERAKELIEKLTNKPALNLYKEYRKKATFYYYVATKDLDYVSERESMQRDVNEAKKKFESYLERHYKDTGAYRSYFVPVNADSGGPGCSMEMLLARIELGAEEYEQLSKLYGLVGELKRKIVKGRVNRRIVGQDISIIFS